MLSILRNHNFRCFKPCSREDTEERNNSINGIFCCMFSSQVGIKQREPRNPTCTCSTSLSNFSSPNIEPNARITHSEGMHQINSIERTSEVRR